MYVKTNILNEAKLIVHFSFYFQYDPRGGDNRSIFYHYLDKRKRDVFVAAIKKAETHTSSFQISNDYKYLILRESKLVSIANVESFDAKIQFKLIFRIFPDVTYVSSSFCLGNVH